MALPERIGRYEVIRPLGEGGMGRVMLARDSVLGREVAVKVMRDDLGLPPEVKRSLFERMRNEARAAAAVRHPNLVVLHDMGESEDVGLFLVFEYVKGPTLRDRLQEGPLPPLEVARMAIELGGALTRAHEAGVIHRDIKPENVILSENGAVLTDFGIARVPDSTLTTAGMVLGTAAYSAPEALAKGEFGPASDQFSLAATLYEALSGRRAFPGDDALTVATRVATEQPAPITESEPDVRRRLVLGRAEAVLRRGMARDPAGRYASCRAFGDALAASIDARVSGGFATFPTHSTSVVPKATRRWQNVFVGAAILVIAALIYFGRRGTSDGASLKHAADDFARTVGSAEATTPPASHTTHHRVTHSHDDAGAADGEPSGTASAPLPVPIPTGPPTASGLPQPF